MKITYKYPVKAIYFSKTKDFNGKIKVWRIKVKVLSETDKSYQIELEEPVRKNFAGDKIWVNKGNVQLLEPKETYQVDGYWYSNIESREIT